MERVVKNPFGMTGAFVPMAFFGMLFVLKLYYGGNEAIGQGIALAVFFVSILVYYFWVVEKRQFFSKEEQHKFMKAYIVNANKNRKRVKVASKPSSKLLRIWTGALVFTSKVSSSHKASGGSSISTMSALVPKVIIYCKDTVVRSNVVRPGPVECLTPSMQGEAIFTVTSLKWTTTEYTLHTY
eukprot:scaffold440_cov277-Ochromonas_danica.AAC.18